MEEKIHVCPWWIGYILASPLRKLYQNPEKILAPCIKKGDVVLEVGPGMGFFSIPAARLVGENGRIVCTELQKKMLKTLEKKLRKKGLLERVDLRMCSSKSLEIGDIAEGIDFAFLFAVVHEMGDQGKIFSEIYYSLKKGGTMLIAEPAGHVTEEELAASVELAEKAGFRVREYPLIKKSKSVLMEK